MSQQSAVRLSSNDLWNKISLLLGQKATNTQRDYRALIGDWCRFLGGSKNTNEDAELMQNASGYDALCYMAELKTRLGQKPRGGNLDRKLTPGTIRKKMVVLRQLYKDLGIYNPFADGALELPSDKEGLKRPTEMIPLDKVKDLLNAPGSLGVKGKRDRALLALLFGGGLRRSEVVVLRIADVKKTDKGTTYLALRNTKSKRDEKQGLPDWAVNSLELYLEARLAEGATPFNHIFVQYRGDPPKPGPRFYDKTLYRLFKKYCDQVGLDPAQYSPHSARASAITKLLVDGFSYRDVQSFSRHASAAMVEVYDKRQRDIDDSLAKKIDY